MRTHKGTMNLTKTIQSQIQTHKHRESESVLLAKNFNIENYSLQLDDVDA